MSGQIHYATAIVQCTLIFERVLPKTGIFICFSTKSDAHHAHTISRKRSDSCCGSNFELAAIKRTVQIDKAGKTAKAHQRRNLPTCYLRRLRASVAFPAPLVRCCWRSTVRPPWRFSSYLRPFPMPRRGRRNNQSNIP